MGDRKERQARRAARAAELRAAPRPPVTDPADGRGSPSATGGWSETVTPIDDAVVLPTSGAGMVQHGGVYRGRHFVHEAVHWRRGKPLLVPIVGRPVAKEDLAGRWLWGGILLNHFGHFLTESTPRLWALRDLAGQLDGIVFLHKRNAEVTEFHRTFLRTLGHDLPIHVVQTPTRVERLHVPGQGFGLGRISQGTARFRDFFRTDFARDVAADGPERLYVSRSALGPKRGGVLGEHLLEEALVAEGYEVFHPQHHPLDVQIARYRAARRIVALDGSALHLAAFACSPDQKIAMIRRRTSSMSNAIVLHIRAFSGVAPDVIDTIRADWVLRDRARADRFSMGELDMPALQQALRRTGYIADGGPDWPALDEAWRDATVDRLREEFGMDYMPIPRGKTAAADDDESGEDA